MRCLLWSALGQGTAAAFGFLLLTMVSRTLGVDAAGVISLQTAVGSLVYSVAVFGVPIFHRTDTESVYSFRDYMAARLLTVGAAGLCALLLMPGGLRAKVPYLSILVFYLLDAVAEGYRCEDFRQGHAERCFQGQCLQYLLPLLLFAVVLYRSKALDAACGALTAASALLLACQAWMRRRGLLSLLRRAMLREALTLLCACAPLLLSALVTMLQVQAAKYLLALYADHALQGYLGMLMMPMAFMNLLGSILSAPYARRISLERQGGVDRLFAYSCCALLTVSVIAALAASRLLPVLSAVYGVSLAGLDQELTLLLLGGGFMACCAFSELRLIAGRRQKWCLMTNLIALGGILLTAALGRYASPLTSVCLGVFAGQGIRLLSQCAVLGTKGAKSK